MFDVVYATPYFAKNVRPQQGKEEKTVAAYNDTDGVTIFDNYRVEESTPPKLQDKTEDQQQTTSVPATSERRNPLRAAAAFLVLLCLLVLTAIITLAVLTVQLQEDNTNLTREKKQLQTSFNNMTEERNQLQTSYNNLTEERNQLQTSYNNLTEERNQLQTSFNNMTEERNQLQTSYNTLTEERSQLQTSYNNLTEESSELKSINHNLTQNMSKLENETHLLRATNKNLTQERDDLKEQLYAKACCPDPWKKFGSNCYFISTSKNNWGDSKADCENKKAQLVIISGDEEQRFIMGLKVRAWIGLTDEENEGTWKWVDGTAPAKTYWRPKQPDNYLQNEHCVETERSYGLRTWNDLDCGTQRHWICEKSVV